MNQCDHRKETCQCDLHSVIHTVVQAVNNLHSVTACLPYTEVPLQFQEWIDISTEASS